MNLEDNRQTASSPAIPIGFAVTGFILSILSLFLSIIVIGLLLAIPGLIFSILHLKKTTIFRSMAIAGIIISVIAIISSLSLGTFYYFSVRNMMSEFGENSAAIKEEWEGRKFPDFQATTLEGEEIVLSELQGRKVVINFWATWCPPCVREIPHFVQATEEIPAEELLIIGISNENEQTIQDFAREYQINYPLIKESALKFTEIEEEFNQERLSTPVEQISSIPTTFFIDKDGVIRNIHVGYIDHNIFMEKVSALHQPEEETL